MTIKLDYNLALAGEQLLHQGLLQVPLIKISTGYGLLAQLANCCPWLRWRGSVVMISG